MRHAIGYVLLGALLGVGICGAQTPEPASDPATGPIVLPHVALPKLPLSAADASLPRFEIVAGRAVLVNAGIAPKGPSARPALAGAGQPIPTDVHAVTALLPTDIRHQVTLCDEPAGGVAISGAASRAGWRRRYASE